MNFNDYKFYKHYGYVGGFNSGNGEYVMAHHKVTKQWGSLNLLSGKFEFLSDYKNPIFDEAIESGIWVEIKIGIKILE